MPDDINSIPHAELEESTLVIRSRCKKCRGKGTQANKSSACTSCGGRGRVFREVSFDRFIRAVVDQLR